MWTQMEVNMPRIPVTVQSKFHNFCERCPLCAVEGEENNFYASNEIVERKSIVTCSHYDFCALLAKAVNDGLVDMKTAKESVSNVDTSQ